MKPIIMFGLKDTDEQLAELNLSTQPYGLFTTREDAETYLTVHNSGLEVAEVEIRPTR